MNTTYYLWKSRNKGRFIFHITDYKEIREDGYANIDSFGFIDVELVFSSIIKNECVAFAQKSILKNFYKLLN